MPDHRSLGEIHPLERTLAGQYQSRIPSSESVAAATVLTDLLGSLCAAR